MRNYQNSYYMKVELGHLKGHSKLWDRTDLETTWKVFTCFSLAWCLIRSSIFYWKPLFQQTFTHPTTVFYHIRLNTKEHEKKRWETCVDQNIMRNKSVTIVAYISEKLNFLYLEPSTMIEASCHFSPLSEVFVDGWLFLDMSIGEFEMVYNKVTKNERSDMK